MPVEPQLILIFLTLGATVGFMAGLFGVGGGGIMVPVLTLVFGTYGIGNENFVHLALGTSMASIVVTSFSSLRSHHLHSAVIWSVVQKMTPGILLGTFLATFLVSFLSPKFLALFFAGFMFIVAVQMILNLKPKKHANEAGLLQLFLAGNFIGAISAIVSIGGGTMTVPYLMWNNVNIKKAIGTAAAIGFPISIAGTIGYIVNGWQKTSNDSYTFGFVYLPAVVLISLVSFFTAPIGAKVVHKLPISTLKKVFALLLVALSLKMLISVI